MEKVTAFQNNLLTLEDKYFILTHQICQYHR